ncbi:hypothetical protein Asp14428_07740 [Actinoplanes sp. NBRC 14428]|nr:hypothetical protein Asp14428_07740 [Actinoplanes sp. NBRC 14428]
MSELDLDADVLVLGGGLAATWAALSAADAGATVVLADKGYCGTSGVTATAGVSHWLVPPERRAAAMAERRSIAAGLADDAWMARVLDETWRRLHAYDLPFPAAVNGRRPYRTIRAPNTCGSCAGWSSGPACGSSTTIPPSSCSPTPTAGCAGPRASAVSTAAAGGGSGPAGWCWRPAAARSARTCSARAATPATGC